MTITTESSSEHRCCGRDQVRRPSPSWRAVNITPIERAGRVLLGGAAGIAALVLLAGAGSLLAVLLEVLLLLAGLDLVVTGVIGHCPLYQRLGYTPASLRRPS